MEVIGPERVEVEMIDSVGADLSHEAESLHQNQSSGAPEKRLAQLNQEAANPFDGSDDELEIEHTVPLSKWNDNASQASGDLRTAMQIGKAYVGSGIMGLPFAFQQSGIVLAVLGMVLISAVSNHCVLLLVECKHHLQTKGHRVKSYGDVSYHAAGAWGGVLVDWVLVISQAGFCVAYLLFIAANIESISHGKITDNVAIAICTVPLLGLVQIRELRWIAPFSIAANLMLLFGVIIVIAFAWPNVDEDAVSEMKQVDWSGAPVFFGMAVYAFEGIGLALPIEHGMRNPANFRTVWTSTIVVITVLFLVFGSIGYCAFGEQVHSVVTHELPKNNMTVAVKLCLCVALYFTYILMCVPVFNILEENWLPQLLAADPVRVGPISTKCWLRAAVVATTAGIAVMVPDFGLMIALVGSLGCNALAFVLPAVFHLLIMKETTTFAVKVLDASIALFGIFAICVCTATTISRMGGEV